MVVVVVVVVGGGSGGSGSGSGSGSGGSSSSSSSSSSSKKGQPLVLRGYGHPRAELATHWFHHSSARGFPCHNMSLS